MNIYVVNKYRRHLGERNLGIEKEYRGDKPFIEELKYSA